MKLEIRKLNIVGFLLCLGLFLPYLGMSFQVFYIHNRLASYLLLILAFILSSNKIRVTLSTIKIIVPIILFLILVAIYSNSIQLNNLFSFDFSHKSGSYFEMKLFFTYFFTIIYILVSMKLAVNINNTNFISGFLFGFFVLWLISTYVGILYSDYWFTNDYSKKLEYEEYKVFSQISMTILQVLGLLYGLYLASYTKKKIRLLMALAIIISSLLFIMIYQQRSAWVFSLICFILYVIYFTKYSLISLIKMAGFISALMFLFFYIIISYDLISNSVISYFEQMINGGLLNSRINYYEFAWSGFLNNPIGSGYGSYATDGPYLYPHNILLESLYELGFLGGFLILYILLYSILVVKKSLIMSRQNNNIFVFTLALLLFYMLVVVFKSGDLTAMGVYFSILILTSNVKKNVKI